jgi:hypothetical protein
MGNAEGGKKEAGKLGGLGSWKAKIDGAKRHQQIVNIH